MTGQQKTAYKLRLGASNRKGPSPKMCRKMFTKGSTLYSTILTVEHILEIDNPQDLVGWYWHASVSRWTHKGVAACKHPRHRQAAFGLIRQMLSGVGDGDNYHYKGRDTKISIKALHYFKALSAAEAAELVN